MRVLALLALVGLAGCAGPQGDGLKVAVALPTKVQSGVAGGSHAPTRGVVRVTDWEPYVINGDETDERRF
ncbi:hypothetical protein [Vannielia litorea]|uniref:hypothetical protein n=1 Tax=Vannielia litorea TaxID=1217970 RepID=UPI001BD0D08A|nr:hypothetical protein [Vannielia litorea]MBS8227842.1 hypothetical protein [Vannielia litorea]